MCSHPTALSPEEVDSFRETGHVRVREAFSPEIAGALREVIWHELESEHGIRADDPTTWRPPPRSPRRAKEHPLNEQAASPRFRGAIDDLLGQGTWKEPGGWGGFLLTFPDGKPEPWDVVHDTWHWDGDPASHGLLIFSFYGTVRPGGGGTLILSGSPRLITSFYASLTPAERRLRHKLHRKLFCAWDPWLEELTGRRSTPGLDRVEHFMAAPTTVRGIPAQVVELTGEPGDAVFCSPGMLHAASPNRSHEPRLMRVKFLLPQSMRLE